ncbi:hypothetical protein [Spirochaeta africana]|nr:hypothetical protein [Spirochaeta africana]
MSTSTSDGEYQRIITIYGTTDSAETDPNVNLTAAPAASGHDLQVDILATTFSLQRGVAYSFRMKAINDEHNIVSELSGNAVNFLQDLDKASISLIDSFNSDTGEVAVRMDEPVTGANEYSIVLSSDENNATGGNVIETISVDRDDLLSDSGARVTVNTGNLTEGGDYYIHLRANDTRDEGTGQDSYSDSIQITYEP